MQIDESDKLLIMIKDIHFGGSIEETLKYYEDIRGLISHSEAIDVDRIRTLQEKESNGIDLSSYLSEEELEKIEDQKSLYNDLVELSNKGNETEKAIANLVLMSDSEIEEELQTIEALDDDVIPPLLEIVSRDEYYSELAPGQGNAPIAALRALMAIGETGALQIIFEKILEVQPHTESAFMRYARKFQEETYDLIIKILSRTSWGRDHEKALVIAGGLDYNQEIRNLCMKILSNPDKCPKDINRQTYLAIIATSNPDDDNENIKKEITRMKHVNAQVKEIIIVE